MGKSLKHLTFIEIDPKDRRRGVFRFNDCGHQQSIHLDQLKKKWGAKCKTCEEQRFYAEAAKAGLRLLGEVQQGEAMGRREYLCLTCKKSLGIGLRDVRNSNFKCPHCLEDKWNVEADAHGLKTLGLAEEDPRRKKGYDLYRFVQCGHEQLIQRTHVREKTAECVDCKTLLHEAEAASKGLQYLRGVDARGGHGSYKFLSCQHVQQISYERVRVNRFHCKACIHLRLEEEASSVGLQLLGKAENDKNTYRSYEQTCGHVRDFTTGAIKKGTFQCDICENSALTRPSEIYLLRMDVSGFEWLKLGISNNIRRRVATYGIPDECGVFLVASLKVGTGREAQARERGFHGSSPWKRRKLPKKKMREFLVDSGATECYPVSYQAEIIEELGLNTKRTPVDLRAH